MVHGNHFFKCMSHENYAEKLIVPKAFRITKLHGVGACEHAKLQTKTGEAWHVKVRSDDEEMWLEKGWEKFLKDNEVRLGDFVVFEHKGDMVFDVLLFDPNAYPLKAAEIYKTSRPHFIKRIAAHNLSKNPLEVPINFARSNGLARKGRTSATLIRDHWKKNLQNVNLAVGREPQERVRFDDEEMWLDKGWKEFVKDNEVSLGDFIVFEHNGNMVFDVLLFDPSACEKEYCSTSKKKNTSNNHKMTALISIKRIPTHNLLKNNPQMVSFSQNLQLLDELLVLPSSFSMFKLLSISYGYAGSTYKICKIKWTLLQRNEGNTKRSPDEESTQFGFSGQI
ncbi:hypothetical protein Sjap_010620 [Stephania japonica]|uniref:TF-B3 domain-containing protein n=1 Tax=Stephania japonica TaxID=461633 RepID=A0AAP0P4B9_9MAGN